MFRATGVFPEPNTRTSPRQAASCHWRRHRLLSMHIRGCFHACQRLSFTPGRFPPLVELLTAAAPVLGNPGRRGDTIVIHVQNLTKYYGDYAAVRDVSFDVERGQIVGFLGPNGAGKTTTMRILAGFLNATSGHATIDGFDVFTESVEVRRRIGYLPENCPLYPEMRVSEYLLFRAGIKGLHGRRHERIDYVVDRCWLKDVRRQPIGTLSKGFRQRVGLADALLAEPPVLILDEPTVGLDPAQIREMRRLIREHGVQHTILM